MLIPRAQYIGQMSYSITVVTGAVIEIDGPESIYTNLYHVVWHSVLSVCYHILSISHKMVMMISQR